MTATERARSHYDRRAVGYADELSRGLLGLMRRRESRAVLALAEPRPGEEVLDAGSGTGFYARRLRECGARVFSVDLSERMVDEARRAGFEAEVADVQQLSLGRTFDLVVCAGVLEFCDRPERAVRLLAEHVAPRGRLLLLFPVQGLWAGAYRIYHRLHGVHARAFSVDRVQAWVERSGLRVSATSHPLPLSAVLRAEKVSP